MRGIRELAELRGQQVRHLLADVDRVVADPLEAARHDQHPQAPFTVLGVMPPGFDFPGSIEIWRPLIYLMFIIIVGEQVCELTGLQLVARAIGTPCSRNRFTLNTG